MATGSEASDPPQLAARLRLLAPACAPTSRPPRALIHATPPPSPSLVSPVPLTPLGAVLSAVPVPGAGGKGQVSPVSPSSLGALLRQPPGRSAAWEWWPAGPAAASLLQKSPWDPVPVATAPPR